MNTTKIDKLQKLIHTVFADGERPKSPGEIVPLEYYDDDYIREYFTGKTWQELANIEDL